MPKITNEEIKNLEYFVNKSQGNLNCLDDDIFEGVMKALDRLAELEVAVAWHGFDELPEKDCQDYSDWVDFFYSGNSDNREDWDIYCGGFNPATGLYMCPHASFVIGVNNVENWNEYDEYDAETLNKLGFTGWRYPVGDLS